MKKQHSLETIGILSSGIAHDFNNLLVTIIGNADLALRNVDSGSPAYRYLQHIKTASVRASDLTEQLLSFTGNGELICEPVELNTLVEELVSLFTNVMSPMVTLKFRFSEESPIILGNLSQVRQVIMNLITNSIDAIGDTDGELIITTGVTESIPEKGNQSFGFVSITDSGCGIDITEKEKIFEPFYTTKPKGKGIGLAIVKDNVACNNGFLTVENRNDGCSGAHISAYFPITDLPVEHTEININNATMYHSSATILVIDDEREVRETTAAMLQDAGFTVHTAHNGEAGISIFEDNIEQIDIVLLDMTLPGIDGFAVAQNLRLIKENCKIIMTSGFHLQQPLDTSSENKNDIFLRKPYQMTKLLNVVCALLKESCDAN